MTVTPEQAIDAANHVYGRHPRWRALHAKGTVLTGTFTAGPQAAGLSRAIHLRGAAHSVIARLSNGSGNPHDPDYAPDVRGLVVKIELPDGSSTDILAQTAARFPAHDPDQFVAMLLALKRPEALWKLPLFLARHRDAVAILPAVVSGMRPPRSYATCRYYAVHAFRWLDAEGGSRYVRYTFVPDAGEAHLLPWELVRRSRNYLQQEIRERLERGPVRFMLELQIAAPGDRVDDPAAAWPADRMRVNAGTLELTDLDSDRERGDDVLLYDPTRVTDGIELSGDPILQFRGPAYSESLKRRTA
jgi:catalase